MAGRGLFPKFAPDGKSIVYVEDPNWAPGGLRRMFAVPSNGGTPEPFVPGWGVIRPPAAVGPIFSPDGSLVLFPGARFAPPSSVDWWVAPLDGSEPWSSKFLDGVSGVDVVEFPVIWLPGRLLYLSGSTIEGINLRSANITSDGSMSGPSRALTAGPGMTWQPTISNEGQILLSRFSWVVHLWEATLNPETGQPVELPRRITGDTSPKFGFSLTHNGDVLAYSTYAGSPGERRTEIHLRSRSDGEESVPISLGEQNINLFPRLNSDGSLLAWRSFREGGSTALVTPTLNPASRQVCEGGTIVDFFADGQHLLVDWGRRVSRMDIETGEDATIFELEERALLDSDLSSDDLWIAIQVGEPDGSVTIQAVPLGGLSTLPDSWIEIARGEPWVGAPRWSADGQTLYYLADRDDFTCVWGQRLDRSTKTPVGEPFAVVHAHSSRMRMLPFHRRVWSLAVGGDRLVFNAGETEGDVYTAMLESTFERWNVRTFGSSGIP